MTEYDATVKRFTGFADQYHAFRPEVPPCIINALCGLAKSCHPDVVVDLGAGTGLSTQPWGAVAKQVIGVEPTCDMLVEAQSHNRQGNIIFKQGYGHLTGIQNGVADIVSCSSSLHWMEPRGTLAEAIRILRPRGVFAFYGYRYPMALAAWEVEAAYRHFRITLDNNERQCRKEAGEETPRWNWSEMYSLMKQCTELLYVNHMYFHNQTILSLDEYMSWIEIHGGVQYLRKHGYTDEKLGLHDLQAVSRRHFNGAALSFCFSYSLHVGIKQ